MDILVVRRKLPQWENYDKNLKSKIKYIEVDNLDFLSTDKVSEYFIDNYDSVFCCLGSRVGKGDEEFIKVDYNQVILDFYLKETLRMEKNLQVY